jgi:nitroimidazol reductase NimA-like FMN-containing flavoprotein (pyridoxamine 5'-phosphate oxidase superfamily)
MSERLGDAHIQQYLATKEVVVLATVSSRGAPLATPMWFLHDAEALTMISVAGLTKVENIQRDPRVCVVAESGTRGDIRSVTLHGRAVLLADTPERRALADRFHDKYRPDLERRWGGRAMPSDRVMFRIWPERVRSQGLDAVER